MSVLIKGMDMPTNCTNCPCSNDDTRFCRAAKEYIPMLGKPEFCPLIPVPTHGRLIDADALKKNMEFTCMGIMAGTEPYNAPLKEIDNAPTIWTQKWIPCSERLPEVGRNVLFSVGDMYTAEGCLRADGDWAQFRWDSIQQKDVVVAWMPLPEPYKEDE